MKKLIDDPQLRCSVALRPDAECKQHCVGRRKSIVSSKYTGSPSIGFRHEGISAKIPKLFPTPPAWWLDPPLLLDPPPMGSR